MQRLEVSGAVRTIYGSLGVKRLSWLITKINVVHSTDGLTAGRTSDRKLKKVTADKKDPVYETPICDNEKRNS